MLSAVSILMVWAVGSGQETFRGAMALVALGSVMRLARCSKNTEEKVCVAVGLLRMALETSLTDTSDRLHAIRRWKPMNTDAVYSAGMS